MRKFFKIIVQVIFSLLGAAILTATAMPPNYGSAVLIGTDAGNGITAPISASSPLPIAVSGVAQVQNSSGTYTDRSGTITTGGASQTLAAANTSRKKLIVQNPPTATENLYINFTAAAGAASGVALVPGAYYEETGNACTTEAITVFGATTAHAFVAKEM